MAITITTMLPQDGISSSRLTINANFEALKDGINSVQLLLDPTTSILQNVKAGTINDSSVSLSTSIFQVGKGSTLLGNVIMGTIGASTSVSINGTGGVSLDTSSLTLGSGNLTLSSATSIATLNGHLSVIKEVRMPGSAVAFSSIIGLTSSTTTSINTADKKYVVIKNDSISSGLTASLSAGNPGQVLEIFHILGASAYPVYIDALNFQGLTGGITLAQTGDTLKCVYDGSNWYLWNYSSASFATNTGATGSSIKFTTI